MQIQCRKKKEYLSKAAMLTVLTDSLRLSIVVVELRRMQVSEFTAAIMNECISKAHSDRSNCSSLLWALYLW
jgi:hypothetical protein